MVIWRWDCRWCDGTGDAGGGCGVCWLFVWRFGKSDVGGAGQSREGLWRRNDWPWSCVIPGVGEAVLRAEGGAVVLGWREQARWWGCLQGLGRGVVRLRCGSERVGAGF